jgi:hypothetical protein
MQTSSTNRNRIWMAALALVAVAAVVVTAAGVGTSPSPVPAHARAFAWLRPRALPAAWSARPLPGSPARLPVPPDWKPADGDPGTRTAISRGPSGRIAGYLNATPRQGAETAANWTVFRVAHNRDEGDRDVRLLAAAAGLRFRGASGSCVLDSYRTGSGARYREVACIVSGRSTTVIVAAAPPRRWSVEAPTIERAISDFTT